MLDQLRFTLILALLRLCSSVWPFLKVENFVKRAVTAMSWKGKLSRQWRQIGGRWYWLDLGDPVCRKLILEGAVDPEIRDHVLDWLPESGIFLDVGAGIGCLSIEAAQRVGKRGKVLAVEPNRSTASVLRENLGRNRILNVSVVPEVSPEIWDKRGFQRLDVVRLASPAGAMQLMLAFEELLVKWHPAVVVETTPPALVFFLENLGYHSQWIGPRGTVFRCHKLAGALEALAERDIWAIPV